MLTTKQKVKGFYQDKTMLEAAIHDPKMKAAWAEKCRLAEALLENTIFFDQEWDMERDIRPITFTNGKIDWNLNPFGDPEWTYMLNRHRFFVLLMEVYAYTKDLRYPEKLFQLWEDWIQHETLIDDHLWTGWRTIESGIRLKNWVKTLNLLDLYRDEITIPSSLKQQIDQSMNQHTDYLCQPKLIDMSYISNWKVLEQNGVWLACYLYPEAIQDADKKRLLSEKVLSESAALQILNDGFHWEQSFMYHHEVWLSLAEVYQIANRNHHLLPEGLQGKLQEMVAASIMLTRPDRKQSPYGDSDLEDMRPILQWMALVTGNPIANWLAGEELFLSTVFDYGEDAKHEWLRLVKQPPYQLDQSFSDSGLIFLRNNWQQDASYTLFKNGPQGGGHGHSDQLHLEIFHQESLLCDSGRYTYIEGSPIRQQFKSAAAHNTVLVDGEEFTRQSGSWGYQGTAPALPNYLRSTEKYAYLEGSHIGYFRYGKNVLLTRKILHLKPGIWLVVDEAVTNEAHDYQQLFHFPKADRLAFRKQHWVYQGESQDLHIYPLSGQEAEKIAGDYSAHYNEKVSSDGLQLTTKGQGRSVMVVLIALEETTITREPLFSSGHQRCESEVTALNLQNSQGSYQVVVNHFEDDTIMGRKADKIAGRFIYGRGVVIEDDDVTVLRS